MTLATWTVEDRVGHIGPGDREARADPDQGAGDGIFETLFHRPVLLEEAVTQLGVQPGGMYVDATVGDGGHTLAMLQASATGGRVLGIDLDPRSLAVAARRLGSFGDRFVPVQGNYAEMATLAQERGIASVDGVLLDLGFSSRQVDEPGYGFSFQRDEPLDMRYDPQGQALTAAHLVNTGGEAELARIIYQYGEEHRSRAIARAIVQNRPLESTRELAELVSRAVGGRRGQRVHPATRTFQALRVAVNAELENLEAGLMAAIGLLAPSGRLAVISYHSLEDRLVKATLAREAASCICPPQAPVCVCGHQPTLRLVSRRVIKPSDEEVRSNPRSRSARMRVAERLH